MKVLMTADAVGGVWTYALELVRALQPLEIEVTLATMGPEPDDAQRAAARRAGADLRVGRFALEWMDDPWADLARAGEWLLDLERDVEPDVVHLNGYVHAQLRWRATVLVAAHSCVLSWWRAVRGEEAPPVWRRYREEVTAGVSRAAAVIAPTKAMLEELRRIYCFDADAFVIPNGRSIEPAQSQKEPLILGAGRLWDEAKNVRALVRVAAELPWPVVLAGDAAGRAGASSNVLAAGRLDERDLIGLMCRASVFASPSRYEPFGLSALEAAMCGCALVVGDIPSLREVWDDAALYVDPDDDAALRRTLVTLIDDEHARRLYAGRAFDRARAYSSDTMATRYLAVYRSLVPAVSAR